MHQLIPSLALLVDSFRDQFDPRVFSTFQALVAGWITCTTPRTISNVWLATGWAARRHHDTAYAVFRSACWEWDDLGIVMATLILTKLIPGGIVWIVVDDTLCPKRGAKVAFGGFFIDPVLSSKRHKVKRFGLNWVVLGIAVPLPMRPDRHWCLPVLWRVYRKKGQAGHVRRTASAAELARLLAESQPERAFWLVADGAYVNSETLKDRPANLQVLGPLRWDAALYGLPEPKAAGSPGAPRKKGERLPTPREMIEDAVGYPAETLKVLLPRGERELRVQRVASVLWYHVCGADPVTVLLVRDPKGQWKDMVLMATATDVTAEFMIQGYCRRWSVEVAFHDSKQLLGLEEPRVWCERSVERAHPMAWFVGTLTVLWYATAGHQGAHLEKERGWYKDKVSPTFSDMLEALRLQMWQAEVSEKSGNGPAPPELVEMLLKRLAAVA